MRWRGWGEHGKVGEVEGGEQGRGEEADKDQARDQWSERRHFVLLVVYLALVEKAGGSVCSGRAVYSSISH